MADMIPPGVPPTTTTSNEDPVSGEDPGTDEVPAIMVTSKITNVTVIEILFMPACSCLDSIITDLPGAINREFGPPPVAVFSFPGLLYFPDRSR